MLCVCEKCDAIFRLTADDESIKGNDRTTYIRIESCDSGGIYATYITCPWCQHKHDLCY